MTESRTSSIAGSLMSSMTAMSDISTATSHSSMNMEGMSGMGSSSTMSGMSMSCTMSMLWNWYTDNVCFISNKWKTTTKAKFGGSCIGVFALMLALNWLRRFMAEYKKECAAQNKAIAQAKISSGKTLKSRTNPFALLDLRQTTFTQDSTNPLLQVLKHQWLDCLSKEHAIVEDDKIYIYQSYFEHILSCVLSTIEWSVLHVIMLLFMYFNGYIFISCMFGAGVGFLFFQYEPGKLTYGCTSPKRCCV